MIDLGQQLKKVFVLVLLVGTQELCWSQSNKQLPKKSFKANTKSQGTKNVDKRTSPKPINVEVKTQGVQDTSKKLPQKTAREEPGDKVVQDTTQTSYEEKKPLELNIRSSADLEVDGLIVDETITKFGRDFYSAFHQNWEAPAMVKNFTVHIKELPTRGIGALIQISVNDELIFEQQMPPRFDVVEEIAHYAVAIVTEYLVNNQLKQQLENDRKRSIEKF